MSKAIYLCYFGVREPLVQTQVITYLSELVKDGHRMSLLTFEPEAIERAEAERIRSELKSKGIAWHHLRYHKRPSALATAYDVFRGAWFIRQAIARDKIDILHGRVHIPTLMGAIARRFSRRRPKLLFDIRGFFPEEYTDAGIWPENGLLYRSAKRVERWLMKESDGFVVLTEKAREILFPNAVPQPDGGWLTSDNVNPPATAGGTDTTARPVEVIPCCVDLNKFNSATEESGREVRNELGIGDRKVIAYVGSFGGWYMTDEMLDLFETALEYDKDTFALILTQRKPEDIRQKLLSRGFADTDFFVGSVAPSEISRYLSSADLAISFIKACYSKQSSSPTKIAEYLACGVPVISNRGVGDIDALFEDRRVGALLDDYSVDSYLNSIKWTESLVDVRANCRQSASENFDLEMIGGARYRRIYHHLLRAL